MSLTPKDPRPALRAHTTARIFLPRAGAALATAPLLARRLAPAAAAALAPHAAPPGRPYDLAIVIADGLSAAAAQAHAAPLLALLLPALRTWSLAPLTLLRHARVAAADPVATLLGAQAVLILIGERPGLSAPDSLGAYLTHNPTPATTDADRNCISNIRPQGLPYPEAAHRLHHLLTRMKTLARTGTTLKDESDHPQTPTPNNPSRVDFQSTNPRPNPRLTTTK